ncbi:MAG: 2-oxoacid:acceptor oxidoreductase family protein [Deltaproteobacteria bacterium]|nr:2-oxoacid:acceptor oxidoreductase family protein [Deltaproteobacteria bacterium]
MEMIHKKLGQILNESVLEIRGDGRAGSGLLLTLQSLAGVAVEDPRLYVQEWPFFSSARKGAPTRGFLRLSRKSIEKASGITTPHIAIMMDEGVTKMVDFAEGVQRGGLFILNTPRTPEEAAKKFRLSGRVYTIDGDALAEKFLKKPLGNVSVFALLSSILPGFDFKTAREHLLHHLQKRRLPEALVEANAELFDASLGQSKMADCDFAFPSDHLLPAFQGYGELMPGGQSRLRLSKTHFTSAFARTGFELRFSDPENSCNGCGHCIINCPENIIQFCADEERGVKVTGADVARYCKLCRECIEICPKKLFQEVAV